MAKLDNFYLTKLEREYLRRRRKRIMRSMARGILVMLGVAAFLFLAYIFMCLGWDIGRVH